jgi:type IV secretion system protein VirB9
MKRFILLMSVALLASCATIDTMRIAEGDGMEPTPAPALALRRAFETIDEPTPIATTVREVRRERERPPLETLAAANVSARQRPNRDNFDAARQTFSYQAGALYELYTNPNFVSTILLEPGETLTDIAAGDTSRWMVTQSETETEQGGRAIVLVKPHTAALRTNIVLITDRRTYLIEAISQGGSAYAAQVAWSYPSTNAAQPAGVPSIDRLNFAYRVRTVRGREPNWAPTRVFDDGRRTWIEFAPEIIASDMPPLFIITADGAEIVNVRVQGRRYMLDRTFDRAELRLGSRAPSIVRIDREGRS